MLGKLEPFQSAWEKNYTGRRIFLTEKGYLGIGPATTKVNDMVMIVKGSYGPYMFRETFETRSNSIDSVQSQGQEELPRHQSEAKEQKFGQGSTEVGDNGIGEQCSESGQGYWKLVGEAYAHGLMHGEGLRIKLRPWKLSMSSKK